MNESNLEEKVEEIGQEVCSEVENVLYDVVSECERARKGSQMWSDGVPDNTYKREIVKSGVDRIVERVKNKILKKVQ